MYQHRTHDEKTWIIAALANMYIYQYRSRWRYTTARLITMNQNGWAQSITVRQTQVHTNAVEDGWVQTTTGWYGYI